LQRIRLKFGSSILIVFGGNLLVWPRASFSSRPARSTAVVSSGCQRWPARRALHPDKLERLGRYEVDLDRKLETMLTMLLRLKDLRQSAG
jgi:hypothetical protein